RGAAGRALTIKQAPPAHRFPAWPARSSPRLPLCPRVGMVRIGAGRVRNAAVRVRTEALPGAEHRWGRGQRDVARTSTARQGGAGGATRPVAVCDACGAAFVVDSDEEVEQPCPWCLGRMRRADSDEVKERLRTTYGANRPPRATDGPRI